MTPAGEPWRVIFTKDAQKDLRSITAAGLKPRLETLLATLAQDPYQPPVEKLIGNLRGLFSRRINIQHRLVYEILADERTVKITSAWLHYGD